MADETSSTDPIELATELKIAWLANPNTNASADDVPTFLQKIHQAVVGLSSGAAAETQPVEPEYTPAVTARRSLSSKDHIISMIDGKPCKALRRHLSGHGLTPDDYRARYGLKSDYPMVSETHRSAATWPRRSGSGARRVQRSPRKLLLRPRKLLRSRGAAPERSRLKPDPRLAAAGRLRRLPGWGCHRPLEGLRPGGGQYRSILAATSERGQGSRFP